MGVITVYLITDKQKREPVINNIIERKEIEGFEQRLRMGFWFREIYILFRLLFWMTSNCVRNKVKPQPWTP